ncbi:hypothetical protein [Wolbachia endosymbiont (group A) of Ancistrocerus nigricornis]|uniref:hypothetical protein n=1 Tax=Wolbachia endosymbiont (group A) of Ancistrocerus nigricornis TaxID=2953974 RepID=UPI002226BCFB|nr:hypothetical protein [Wolbachia endosymbiont (group A) of Ancistrocerus nigricornis]
MKAVTKEELEQLRKKGSKIKANSKTTPSAALKQAEDYTKGFQPNVMRVLTTAENILCVGVNLDHPSPISDIVAKSRDQEITPLFNEILISIDGRNNGRVNEEGLKKKVQNNIKRIYHTFPGTGEKGDNHYFSRFLLGQSLLLNEVEVLESNFKKHVFIYGENIPTEAQSEPQSQRLKDQKSKGQGAGQPSRLDQSHGVVTIVLVSKSAQKSVCVMNIVETDGRDNVINKGIPLDKLRQEIGDRRVVELNLNFNVNKQKEKFEEYFSMEIRAPIPLAQYTSGMPDKFQGDFENIPYPDRLKEVFDEALESQLASSQDQSSSQSIDKYKGLFKKLGEAVLPFKVLIEKEAHTQAVLNGTFSHYSDIRLGEPQEEDRALILTEFQTGRGKRIDMLVHGIKFADQAGSAKEYAPVGLEIKGPRKNVTVQRLKQEAVKQIEMYKECVTCKTLTDGNTVAFVGVVFDEKARDAGSLISTTEDFIMGIARHSSILSVEQLQSLHFNREQQEVFSRFVSHNFPNASIAPVKQGLYLPPFEKRGVKIDGKCVSITRSLSQALFSQSNESFLSNLKASSEIYERIAQGKQISKREEREVFAFSKLLSNFERQLDSATSSIPSSLILNTKKDRKAFSDLSNHIAEIEGDFAIHLVTSNHVVAIYRIGDNYAYFDSNVVFVSELKNVDQLMKIVEKAVESAGYKVGEKGFLVEHFDVDKANSQLSDKDRQILAKEIKTEHQLLAEQDDELGLIKINGQELSRVQLYDFGTKINVEGSVPLLINAEMNLSSEKFQDHLDKREVSMTAREYLDHLKDSENVKEIIQATKAIPFMGSKREIEEAEQTRRPKQSLLELAKGTINCILAAVSLTSASRSKSQLPEKVGNEPQTYLNDPTADKQLQRSVS